MIPRRSAGMATASSPSMTGRPSCTSTTSSSARTDPATGGRPVPLNRPARAADPLGHPMDRPDESAPRQPLSIQTSGQQFGRYFLLRRLGAGGMAAVFLPPAPPPGGLRKIL